MNDDKRKFDLPTKPNPEDEGEAVTVTFCEQLVTPCQFNQIRFGNITYTTHIRKGETPTDAYNRAWQFVENMARAQYKRATGVFWDAYKERDANSSKESW